MHFKQISAENKTIFVHFEEAGEKIPFILVVLTHLYCSIRLAANLQVNLLCVFHFYRQRRSFEQKKSFIPKKSPQNSTFLIIYYNYLKIVTLLRDDLYIFYYSIDLPTFAWIQIADRRCKYIQYSIELFDKFINKHDQADQKIRGKNRQGE